jgi:glutamine amidotransferase
MLTIVDYGGGNLTSVLNAFASIGVTSKITSDPAEIIQASRIVFPGVGAAGASMKTLKDRNLDQAFVAAVNKGIPTLGICVGCQIILNSSKEDGGTNCLELIPGNAKKFNQESGLKIPHMGWNQVHFTADHPVLKGIANNSDFYFVHSYHPVVENSFSLATTEYGSQAFASILVKDNLIATQFHAEKSGRVGLQLLKNFSTWEF